MRTGVGMTRWVVSLHVNGDNVQITEKEKNPMKTKEELNALKEEVEAVNKKLAELTEEELAQVSGGVASAAAMFGGAFA